MKLILCGKGGSGKSTISALLARAYAARGFKVLVVDSDESNFGLHRQLGLGLPEDFTHFFGHKKGIYEEGAQDVFAGGWHLEDVPEAFMSTDGSVRLMATGKITDAGEGCACAMGTLTKTFLEHLKLRYDEVAIVDTEAGVEHFGRGIDRFADAILMIADPSYESVQLAGKITEMGKSFGKPVYIVLNKVDEQQRQLMEEQRALGELFFLMLTELEDITFNESMMILVEAMFQSVKSVFQITDEQLELFAEDFYNRLPDYMQKALDYTPKLAA